MELAKNRIFPDRKAFLYLYMYSRTPFSAQYSCCSSPCSILLIASSQAGDGILGLERPSAMAPLVAVVLQWMDFFLSLITVLTLIVIPFLNRRAQERVTSYVDPPILSLLWLENEGNPFMYYIFSFHTSSGCSTRIMWNKILAEGSALSTPYEITRGAICLLVTCRTLRLEVTLVVQAEDCRRLQWLGLHNQVQMIYMPNVTVSIICFECICQLNFSAPARKLYSYQYKSYA